MQVNKFFSNKISVNRLLNTSTRCCSRKTPIKEVNYPPVKPKYPPGIWGTITPKRAWERHEILETLMSKPTAKWRLEEMAGELPGKIMWMVEAVDPQPGTLPYKQYITKTHLQRNLPNLYNATEDDILQRLAERVRSQVMDVILMEEELCRNEPATRYFANPESVAPYLSERVAKQIMDVLINNVGYDVPHLLEAQVDGNVPVQSFWQRIGCGKEDDFKTFGRYNYGAGRLWFQGVHRASLQIRSELPLPEFLPLEDGMCNGPVENVKYSPAAYGMRHERRRSFNTTGHWQEDPCEFTQLSVTVPNERFHYFIEMFGERFYDDICTNYGMTAAFLSCTAQAHNQGFNWLMDLTYPFTTQTIVTDGRWFQLLAYQLNTLRLWVDDDANTLRNLCWTTNRMPLYETIENGQLRGFNDDVLKLLLKFVVMEPRDRGVDLRPYLPQELPPNKRKETYINLKGEEPFPFTDKPGQFEFRRNSAYFQQNTQ